MRLAEVGDRVLVEVALERLRRHLRRVVEGELHRTGVAGGDVAGQQQLVGQRPAAGLRERAAGAGAVVQVGRLEHDVAVVLDHDVAVRAEVVQRGQGRAVREPEPEVRVGGAGVRVGHRGRLRDAGQQVVEREVHVLRAGAAVGAEVHRADGAVHRATVGVAEVGAGAARTPDDGHDQRAHESHEQARALPVPRLPRQRAQLVHRDFLSIRIVKGMCSSIARTHEKIPRNRTISIKIIQ